jgi:hypothetical protein
MFENNENYVEEYDEELDSISTSIPKHEENSISLIQHGRYTNHIANTYNNFVMGYHFFIAFFLFLILLNDI